MKITVFTSNQPRHLALIERLSAFAEVFAVQECSTLKPGAEASKMVPKSPTMQRYFERVIAAEKAVFGAPNINRPNITTLPIEMGTLNALSMESLKDALDANILIVFGASYIKAPLIDALIARKAVNIHMGVSPYFRGAACNFWAVYDGHPELVGSTIHLLSKGLDSGDILFHAMPKAEPCDPFELGMKAVQAAHVALSDHIQKSTLFKHTPVPQDRSQEIRYSRYSDFTDAVAEDYLARVPTPEEIGVALKEGCADTPLLRPVFI